MIRLLVATILSTWLVFPALGAGLDAAWSSSRFFWIGLGSRQEKSMASSVRTRKKL